MIDRLTERMDRSEKNLEIKYKREIKAVFWCRNGAPEPIRIEGDMEGLTGYTLAEVERGGLFETLKIIPLDFEYITELLRERDVVFKNNSMTRKDGKVIYVRSTLRRVSEFRVEEYTHDIEDEVG